MSKGKLIKVCGECANYDWKKHRCKLGCNEGEPQEPFYTDCPLPTVDTDQICKQSEGEWVFNRGRTYGEPAYYCSLCGEGASDYGMDNFCPHCGAKMKGGAE